MAGRVARDMRGAACEADTWPLDFDDGQTPGREHPANSPQQRRRVAADADASVDEEHRRPSTLVGKLLEDGAGEHGRAALGGKLRGERRDVDTKCGDPGLGERCNETPRAAADFEHRACQAREDFSLNEIDRPRPGAQIEHAERCGFVNSHVVIGPSVVVGGVFGARCRIQPIAMDPATATQIAISTAA